MAKTLQQIYKDKIIPELKAATGIKNTHALPRITCVVINSGIGSYVTAGKDHEDVITNIATISGQKPVLKRSRKAISNFKLKINMPTGVMVTLRGKRMYDFLNKLINVVLPRIRDFRGISKKAFDGHGNYSLGIREHSVFPEIQAEDVSKIHGLQVTILTTAKNNKDGLTLLKAFGFPFKK